MSEHDRHGINFHVRVFGIEFMREQRQAKVKTAMKKDDKAKMEQTRAGYIIVCLAYKNAYKSPTHAVALCPHFPPKRGLLFFRFFPFKYVVPDFAVRTRKH